MKKSALLSFLLLIFSLFVFTSCTKGPTFSGQFMQEEFVFEVGENIDFYDKINLVGIEKDQVEFSLTQGIAVKTPEGYQMTNSGKAIITASVDNATLDSAIVYVKGQFDIPTNVSLNEDGTITWDHVYTYFDGKVVEAQGYTIIVNGGQEQYVSTPSFKLPQTGSFSVKIKANGHKYVKESDFFEKQFDYYTMDEQSIRDVTLKSSSSKNQLSTGVMSLSWQGDGSAYYDVLVEGIKISNDQMTTTNIEIDFSRFKGGDEIDVAIIANDRNVENARMPYRKSIKVKKLDDINLNYDPSHNDIRWTGSFGEYVVRYSNSLSTKEGFIEDFETDNGTYYTKLESLESDLYNLKVQAKGGLVDGIYYADSNIASLNEIAKLATPQFTYKFENDKLILQLNAESYEERFLLEINKQPEVLDLQQNRQIEIMLSDLALGKVDLAISALASLDGQQIKEIEINGTRTNKIVASDVFEDYVYKIANFDEVVHDLQDSDSVLSVNKIENTTKDDYKVLVNGEEISAATINEAEGKITLTIKNLAQYLPQANAYNFEIVASRKDGRSNSVSIKKQISILSKASAASQQENGYFEWTSEYQSGVKYRYTIFSSVDGKVMGQQLEGYPKEVADAPLKNAEKLQHGYYFIKVEALSTDYNLYLDSNFGNHVQNNFLQESFSVFVTIQNPAIQFTYDEASDVYKLTISATQYAKQYLIMLDGQQLADGNLVPSGQLDKYVYVFNDQKFLDDNGKSKQYLISVQATIGEDGDKVIYHSSNLSNITVVRLAQPVFDPITEEEILNVQMPEGAKSVEIKKDGEVVNGMGESQISLKTVTSLSYITLKYVAQAGQEDLVYLDSAEKVYTFRRLDTPNTLSYQNQVLSYLCASQEQTLKYTIKLVFANRDNGDKQYINRTESNTTSFGLNDYIDSRREESEFFTDYSQANNILVSVSAFRIGENEGVYYLPSAFSSPLSISKLPAPVIAFDTEKLQVEWDSIGDVGNTTYSVYIKGSKVAENITATAYSLTDGSVNLLEEQDIFVYAENPSYLTSANSNNIVVRKLERVGSMFITQDQTQGISNIAGADLSKLKEVQVNGKAVVLTQAGELILTFADYKQDRYTFDIQVIADESEVIAGVTYYYISSDKTQFVFVNLAEVETSVTNDGDKITFTQLGASFSGVEESPLSYTLNILKEEQIVESTQLEKTEISLDDSLLTALAAGQYQLQFVGAIKSYTITVVDNNAFGYFGKKEIGKTDVKKLETISSYAYQVEETSDTNKIDRRKNGGVIIMWDDVWKDDGVMFDIIIDVGDPSLDFIKDALKDITPGFRYPSLSLLPKFFGLEKRDGKYIFTITSNATPYFDAGTLTVPVHIHKAGAISADDVDVEITKLQNVQQATLNADGKLTFNHVSGATQYLIQLILGGQEKELLEYNVERVSSTYTVDLWDKFEDFAGNYSVLVYADDTTNECLPAKDSKEITGYRLKGLSSVQVEDSGKINLNISTEDKPYLENIQFMVKYKNKLYPLTAEQEGENYFTSTTDIISLFGEENVDDGEVNIEVYVLQEGCITSAASICKFNYLHSEGNGLVARREKSFVDGQLNDNMEKDYLVLTDNVQQTVGLWIEYHYFEQVESEEEDDQEAQPPKEVVVKVPYLTQDLIGYWITAEDGSEYFSKENIAGKGQLCFALEINTLLDKLGGGQYTFYITRIVNNEGTVTQYGTSTYSITKLDKLDNSSVNLKGKVLVWEGNKDTQVTGFYVSMYEHNGQDSTLLQRITVSGTTSLDLTNYVNEVGKNYYFGIKAVSSVAGVVASIETSHITVSQYGTPSPLEVKAGVLQFSEESIKQMQLLKDIQENYNEPRKMAEVINGHSGSNAYKVPFTFDARSIGERKVQIKFEQITDGDSGRTYYATMPAIDLLAAFLKEYKFTVEDQQLSYLDTLYNAAQDANVIQSPYASIMNALAEALKACKFGLGSQELLFDDYGDNVPAGEYKISVRQEGSEVDRISSSAMLPSEYSSSVTQSVSQEPSLRLDSKNTGVKNVYYLSFLPINIISKQQGKTESVPAVNYILNMRTPGQDTREFEIRKESQGWKLYYFDGEQKSIDLKSGLFDSYVTIDLTNDFAKKINNLFNTASKVSVYAIGNDYAINSKTNQKDVSFLDFDYSSLKLVNGKMSWVSRSKNGTLVSYKHATSINTQLEVISNQETQTLSLPQSGLYEFVMFTALGGISADSVIVDSESYRLSNLYKRATPSASTYNGMIRISGGSDDSTYVKFSQFNISTNLSDKKSTSTQYLSSAGQRVNYTPGDYQSFADGTDDRFCREKELQATTYYISAAGNSINVPAGQSHFSSVKVEGNEDYDYTLTINDQSVAYCVLESTPFTFAAQMLTEATDAYIHDGNMLFEAPTSQDEESFMIGYKINVYHYSSLLDADTNHVQVSSFFTLNEEFASDRIVALINAPYYTISVQPFAFAKATAQTSGALQTIEGDYVIYDNNAVYKNGNHVLLGPENAFGEKRIQKSEMPDEVNVLGNSIEIRQTYNSGLGILVYRIIDQNGKEIKGEQTNTIVSEHSVQYQITTFVPARDQLVYGKAYNLSVYAYIKGDQKFGEATIAYITSSGRIIEKTIYKLKTLSLDELQLDYSISSATYDLNLQNYFDSSKVANSASYMKVRAHFKKDNSQEGDDVYVDVFSSNPHIQLKKENVSKPTIFNNIVQITDNTIVEFEVLHSGISGNVEIIASDRGETLTLRTTSFAYNDQVEWDVSDLTFTFTSSKFVITKPQASAYIFKDEKTKVEASYPLHKDDIVLLTGEKLEFEGQVYLQTTIKQEEKYLYVLQDDVEIQDYLVSDNNGKQSSREFVVAVQYTNGELEISPIITATTKQQLSYQPKNPGSIASVSVYVRDSALSLFCDKPLYKEGPFLFDIFDDGQGSEISPYQISSAEQFANIKLRNRAGQKYYFVLTQSFEFEVGEEGFLSEAFYGVLDGGGQTITLKFSSFKNLQSTSIILPTGNTTTNEYKISSEVSLFSAISSQAQVKDLNIKAEVDIQSVGAGGCLIAPLACINNGTINNVNLLQIDVSASVSRTSLVAIAGIVGTNSGTIDGCVNQSTPDINVYGISQAVANVAYAGIAMICKDSSAVVNNCFSTGNIEIVAQSNLGNIWASGLIGTLSSNATISNSGNDSDIKFTKSSGVNTFGGYAAGIAMRIVSANMSMCYNNGAIEIENQNNAAGIAFSITSRSNINRIVETSGKKIAISVTSEVSSSECYASVSVDNISTQEVDNSILLNFGNYTLKVENYKAIITKN